MTMFVEPVRALFAEPEAADYAGTGTSEVVFTIHQGDGGSDIASNLVSDGVIKSYAPFYELLVSTRPSRCSSPAPTRSRPR
ncbi:endolytic transglycosylase MltG [Rathayibacter sp. VKM Ac-2630]|uniref:endolytic transglycosylase MltG n=1 Tax=Rathayibacter sp. VKM Ac-2630 TaxID=1938617 RepID=UPI001F26C43E|nr:endolytic transglycosylase MltG [Rathayibacter sp. VKM Ac-2630]